MDMEQYEEAVRDYEKILQLDKTRGACELLEINFTFLNNEDIY